MENRKARAEITFDFLHILENYSRQVLRVRASQMDLASDADDAFNLL